MTKLDTRVTTNNQILLPKRGRTELFCVTRVLISIIDVHWIARIIIAIQLKWLQDARRFTATSRVEVILMLRTMASNRCGSKWPPPPQPPPPPTPSPPPSSSLSRHACSGILGDVNNRRRDVPFWWTGFPICHSDRLDCKSTELYVSYRQRNAVCISFLEGKGTTRMQ